MTMVSSVMPVEFLNPSQLPVGIGSAELGAAGGQEQGQPGGGDRQRRTPGAGGEAGRPHDGHLTSWG